MSENERNFIQSKGIIPPVTLQMLDAPEQKEEDHAVQALPVGTDSDDFLELCGEKIPRKTYWQCQLIKNTLQNMNKKYGTVILTDTQLEEWFMDKYHRGFTINGKTITDITALFTHYCEQIVFNIPSSSDISVITFHN